MLNRPHLTIVLLLMTFPTLAQRMTFSGGAGIGTYAMGDLKIFQTELKQDFPVDATITDKFPSYYFYEGSLSIGLGSQFFVGGSFAYGSTGGRVQYRDYSGYLRADQKLRYMNLGIPIGYRMKIKEKMILSADLKPIYTFSNLDVKFEQEIAGDYDQEEVKLNSQNIAMELGATLTRRFFERFGVYARVGYYLTLVKGKLYLNDNSNAYLIRNNSDPVYATWDGLRLSLGATFYLSGTEGN